MPSNRIDFKAKQESLRRPLILDGATGSLLQQRAAILDKFLWSSIAGIKNPEILRTIYKDYIDSGAEIITTNTFRTNPAALKLSGYDIQIDKFVEKNLDAAFEERSEKEILIAGSNAPAEDCYQKERTISKFDLDYNHKKHIEILWEGGVDIIWNETQSHWDEIEIICKFCSYNSLPFALNFYFDEELKLLSGEPLSEAILFVQEYNPTAIGFNCIKPSVFIKYFEKDSLPNNWGCYFNCGKGEVNDSQITCGIEPAEYTEFIRTILVKNPLFVGSCCGSSPFHTKAIRELLDALYRN